MSIRVGVADDHEVVRKGIIALLEQETDLSIVGEAKNEAEIWDVVSEKQPDVLLLDLFFEQRPLGLQIISQLLNKYSRLKIVVFSIYNDDKYILNCIQQGALSYIIKSFDRKDIIQAIRCAKAGMAYFTPEIATIIQRALVGYKPIAPLSYSSGMASQYPLHLLSEKEKIILRLISEGHSSRDIALQLGLSIYTVNNHRINMIKKIQVKNSTELVRIAQEAGHL